MDTGYIYCPNKIKLFAHSAVFIVLIGSLLTNQQVDAIKCYVCQSNVDPKCASSPFDNKTLPITDCDEYPRADLVPKTGFDLVEEKSFLNFFNQPAPAKSLRATMCRKIRQKVNGDWRTIRGCGYITPDNVKPSADGIIDYCQIRHGTYDIFVETCTCNSKDGCNAASSPFSEPQLMIMKSLTVLTMAIISYIYSL